MLLERVHAGSLRLVGHVTGRTYTFTADEPVQLVDTQDSGTLLGSGLVRIVR
jgi:hypothetical protein